MGARWYEGRIGRWVSADTIVPDPFNPQSLNRYSYVFGSPLRLVDPSGYDPLDAAWEAEFEAARGCERGQCPPGTYDRLPRLLSIAFPDDYDHDLFYDSAGRLRLSDRELQHVLGTFLGRTWDEMLPTLQRLSGWYEAGEEWMFMRDIGSLFGGLPDRFDQPSWRAAVHGDMPDAQHHWVGLSSSGASEYFGLDLVGEDWDANVHHWAWAAVLGYYTGPAGPLITTGRELSRVNWADAVLAPGPVLGVNNLADIRMGNRAARFGFGVRVLGIGHRALAVAWRVGM